MYVLIDGRSLCRAEGFSWIMKVLFNFFFRKILCHDRIQKKAWIFTIHIRNTVECLVCEWVICNLRVHTERRFPISGVHPILMEKSALAGEGGGCTPTPFQPIAITYKVAVYAPAEWADTLTLFHLYLYMYSLFVTCGFACFRIGKLSRLQEQSCGVDPPGSARGNQVR